MNELASAAQAIRRGEKIPIERVLSTLKEAGNQRRSHQTSFLQRVSGGTIVVGPIRGHATDFAHYVLTQVLPATSVKNVVLLGNYIDGAHQSVETLYLVALLILFSGKTVIPLIGKHELQYPVQPDNFGSLKNELALRSMHSGVAVDEYEEEVKRFFATLAIACLIDERFFCVAGGPASRYRFLPQIAAAGSQEVLQEFVLNEQMDEDEERIAAGCAFVASPSEGAFRFTFNAVCNFVSRNNLAAMIVGMEYHTNRPDYDSFARPNHYKESIYFPGYMLGRIHPDTQIPALVTIFSAPSFCGVNRNNACIIIVSENRLKIHELKEYPERQLIIPGSQDHAFSFAQPMLEKAITAIVREMVFGTIVEDSASTSDECFKQREAIAVAKMRRMCQLLKAHDLPLPDVPKDV